VKEQVFWYQKRSGYRIIITIIVMILFVLAFETRGETIHEEIKKAK